MGQSSALSAANTGMESMEAASSNSKMVIGIIGAAVPIMYAS